MAILLRCVTCHDWKGRPDQTISVIASGTVQECVEAMNVNVLSWQAEDLHEDDLHKELHDGVKQVSKWDDDKTRWEMQKGVAYDKVEMITSLYEELTRLGAQSVALREFVWKGEDNTTSLIYHIINGE